MIIPNTGSNMSIIIHASVAEGFRRSRKIIVSATTKLRHSNTIVNLSPINVLIASQDISAIYRSSCLFIYFFVVGVIFSVVSGGCARTYSDKHKTEKTMTAARIIFFLKLETYIFFATDNLLGGLYFVWSPYIFAK